MSLFEFCRDFDFLQAPPKTRQILQNGLLDIVGVMAGAASNDTSSALRRFAVSHYPAGQFSSRLMFDGRRVSLLGAGWAGGFSADSLDAHEGHFRSKGHAGATVVPAVLALADALHHQGKEISGHELLSALCIGYETALRAGTALMATSRPITPPVVFPASAWSAPAPDCWGSMSRPFAMPWASPNTSAPVAR